ncbi:protein BRANCHLESS TRICHOME [Benincasa hispida]|uniref:protein BRANCHLESS TRICHOME n=1 Tax=Benincasa hispida TaxID=102211 RepID=UPI0019029A0A|nr:protein BRANCHLESS TRICHOME [Benincasa hispida]
MENEMMIDETSPSWKLYENPFYISPSHHHRRHHRQIDHHKSSLNNQLQFYCLKFSSSSSCDLFPTKRRMDSELDLARSQIVELKTELRYERKARKKLESLAKRLAKELDEERKQREAMEGLCQELAREISSHEAQIDLMKKEIEDERKMLRLAEVLREERVQMKLAEVKIVFEHMLSEIESGTTNNNNTAVFSEHTVAENPSASSDNNNTIGDGDGSSPRESTRSDAAEGEQRLSCSNMAAPRSVSPELENNNPHIVRGIKGFVEFRRVFRTKGSKNRDSDAKLECQKAQLRVLLKHKDTLRSNNLIIT